MNPEEIEMLSRSPGHYFTVEGYNVMQISKARRSPFFWRLLTQTELCRHADALLQWGIFSKSHTHGLSAPIELDRIEGYCSSELTAKCVVDKWNNEAALVLITEGTKAAKLIEI